MYTISDIISMFLTSVSSQDISRLTSHASSNLVLPPNRSTTDAILDLHILAELHREFQRPLNVAYIDIKDAFNSVDQMSQWKVLRGNGVPLSFLNPIQNLHEDTIACVRVDPKYQHLSQHPL